MSFRPQLSGAMSAKLNAAGLSAEHSLLLPEREAQGDENAIMQSIGEIYGATPSETTFAPFANDIILTLPNGDVVVGAVAFRSKFEESWKTNATRRTTLRLLQSPESLTQGTLCVDIVMSMYETSATAELNLLKTVRSLVVLRRRSDGLISGMTEEEGHRRATAPLAARTAAASNFYSHSPTDNMVSPCTSKLNLSKKKHFMKAKPTTLFPGAASRTPSSLSRQGSENDTMEL